MKKKLPLVLIFALVFTMISSCSQPLTEYQDTFTPETGYNEPESIESTELSESSETWKFYDLDEDDDENAEQFNMEDGPVFVDMGYEFQGHSGQYNHRYLPDLHLYQINIENGNTKDIFTFQNENYKWGPPTTGKYSFSLNVGPRQNWCNYVGRQLFDEKFERIAVNWFESEDWSEHVGWIDKNGSVTDVTNIIHPTGEGFSSKAPKDTNALFSPDGYFFYIDGNDEKYHYIDINTFSQVKEEEPLEYNSDSIMFLPDGSLGRQSWQVIVEGDKYSLDTNDGKGLYTFCKFDDKCSVLSQNFWSGGRIGLTGPNYSSMHAGYDGSMDYYTNEDRDHNGEYVKYITPESDYYIDAAAGYNKQIAFTASRGEERALFVTDDSGTAEPRKVKDIDKSEFLLCWY